MKTKQLSIWLYAFTLIVISCLLSCDAENDMTISSANEDYHFSLQLKGEDLSYQKEKYPELVTFILKITPKDQKDLIESLLLKSNLSSEENAIYYLSFGLKNEIKIKDEGNRVYEPGIFHFERSFDLKQSRNFLMSFDLSSIENESTIWLEIDTKVFGIAPIKINLNEFKLFKS